MTRGIFTDDGPRNDRRLPIVVAWLAVVCVLARQHVFWRDEVRALSLALQGDDVFAMLGALRGEGHPALWYLLLRGAHALFDTPLILPAVALLVALAAMLVLAWRSPFAAPLLVLVMFSRFGVYEYSVMARNYGITMLLLFVFAAVYARYRERSLVLGALLFLLANCSVHSLILAGALGLFWLLDLARSGLTGAHLRHLAANAALALLGVALCLVTLFPTVNDAASQPEPLAQTLPRLALGVLLPGAPFEQLLPMAVLTAHLPIPAGLIHAGLSVLIFAAIAGLAHRPAAFWAAIAALLAYVTLFSVLYEGFYRHEALWVVFVVTLYWLAGPPPADAPRPARRWLARAGIAGLVALLLVQVGNGLVQAFWLIDGSKPESRSRDFAAWVARTPGLERAAIIADPDYLVETAPYYLPGHPTFLMREERYGNVVHFTHDARASLDLDDVLGAARRVRSETGRPVLILINQPLEQLQEPSPGDAGQWRLLATPAQRQRFTAAAPLVQRFAPACCSDESFDVYLFGSVD